MPCRYTFFEPYELSNYSIKGAGGWDILEFLPVPLSEVTDAWCGSECRGSGECVNLCMHVYI